MEREPDVIIVGAGAAGLAAARTLTRSGTAVAIIEARERLGGRIWTIDDPLSAAPVELGAEFVHGRPPEIWSMTENHGLAAHEMAGGHVRSEKGAPEPDESFFERVEGLLDRLNSAPDQSFREYIDAAEAPPALKRWAVRYVEGFNAARQELIGTASLAQQNEAAKSIGGDRLFRIEGGYGALIQAIAGGMDRGLARIYMGAAVDAVSWRRGYVEVRASRAGGLRLNMRAPHAVVTVPLGVLQRKTIAFDPEPVNLRDACEALVMGHAARITLRFRRPFWEKRPEFRNLGMLHSGEDWMPTWWTALPVGAPVITGWTGGPAAEQCSEEDPALWLPRALRTLARLLRTDVASLAGELESWHAHNWAADPFARGAYSYVRPGGLDAQRRFAEPVEDTLYFAGEAANAEGHCGMVHGAIASGEHAARLILNKAQRPSICTGNAG